MPYAITLLLDDESAARISAMYKRLSNLRISHDQVSLGYPPHITLGVLDDAADPQELIDTLSATAIDWRPLSVPIVGFGVFPGTPLALWVCPAMTIELLDRYSALCAALPPSRLRDQYRAGRWVPHVTLAKDPSTPSAALAAVQEMELPVHATLHEVQLIQFRPARVLWQLRLTFKG
jgi:2'-5' RNA ligase